MVSVETSQLIEQMERHFDLGIRRVEVVKEKANWHVYKLHCATRSFFLKLAIGSFSRGRAARVSEEAALIVYLNGCGFNAPTLVATVPGKRTVEIGLEDVPACGYLTEEIEISEVGIDLDDEIHLRRVAAKLAQFHTLTDALEEGFTAVRWNRNSLIDRNLQLVEPLFEERRGDYEALCSSFDRVKKEISRSWKKSDGAWGIPLTAGIPAHAARFDIKGSDRT